MTRPRLRGLGLRARITIVFALGALAVSTSLAVTTYELTRHSLLVERELTAVRAAYFDAALAQQGLGGQDSDIAQVLRNLDTGELRRPLIRRDGQWFARTADDGLTGSVPPQLQALVRSGRPAVQLVRLRDQPALVVGVPLADVGLADVGLADVGLAEAGLAEVGPADVELVESGAEGQPIAV